MLSNMGVWVHMQAQEFSKICNPLFKQIARCLNSSHFQVALPPNNLLPSLLWSARLQHAAIMPGF